MKTKLRLVVIVAMMAFAAAIAHFYLPKQTANPAPPNLETSLHSSPEGSPGTAAPETTPAARSFTPVAGQHAFHDAPGAEPAPGTNKLQRLTQIRETFRTLAAGEPITALRAAKELANGTERETALLTLATEWTHAELSPPEERARAIDLYGLEAGLGMELAKNPELAVLWANELTDGQGRRALLQHTAVEMTDTDPGAAFALGQQLSDEERRGFYNAVFAGWGTKDTDSAIQWADQLPDPTERDSAIQAIRSVAPVGIGAALSMQNGYPVINQVLPGAPAQLSGQIHPGDRILALAQGDNVFVDAQGLSLADIVQRIRGEPGTPLQLQILPADAPPDSQPRTVSVMRDQIRFKRQPSPQGG